MEIQFIKYPTTTKTCFGCGKELPGGESYMIMKKSGFSGKGVARWEIRKCHERIYVCPLCLAVCLMKDNGTQGDIRENEFAEGRIANVNRKNREKAIIMLRAGKDYLEMITELQEKATSSKKEK